MKHFIDLHQHSKADLRSILNEALKIKRLTKDGVEHKPLKGKTLAMIFDKPSTRTRVSFDVGMRQLGGETIMLTGAEMQLGRGESFADTARVLSRYVDMIMIRLLDHAAVQELAKFSSIPVINGLTKLSHPCQAMADVMTFEEHRGSIKGKKISYVGDANNVLTSWVHAAHSFDFEMSVATPSELAPPVHLLSFIKQTGAKVSIGTNPHEAVKNSDCVVTDCWVSMGDENEGLRHNLLRPYQVNKTLMKDASGEALFMHCLPAHRGEEVSDEIMDSKNSVVFDEAENRLHAQKAIMTFCMGV